MITVNFDELQRQAAMMDEQAANLEKEAARLRGKAEGLREGLRLAIDAVTTAKSDEPADEGEE
jgi:hypothetical protein